jgi:hypothetical protein
MEESKRRAKTPDRPRRQIKKFPCANPAKPACVSSGHFSTPVKSPNAASYIHKKTRDNPKNR